MNIERINKMLAGTGETVSPINVHKNGEDRVGLAVHRDGYTTGQIVYYGECDTDGDIVSRIRHLDDMEVASVEDGVMYALNDRDYFLGNCIICVQQKDAIGSRIISDDKPSNLLRRPLLNQEAYIRLMLDEAGLADSSVKVEDKMLDRLGLDEDTVWEHAADNTRKQLQCIPMAEVIREIAGEDYDSSGDVPMYIMTRESNQYGASALLFPDLFQDLCRSQGWQGCSILPSSIHEVIAVPGEYQMETGEGTALVGEINENDVSPEEQLTPAVYRYTLEANEIMVEP